MPEAGTSTEKNDDDHEVHDSIGNPESRYDLKPSDDSPGSPDRSIARSHSSTATSPSEEPVVVNFVPSDDDDDGGDHDDGDVPDVFVDAQSSHGESYTRCLVSYHKDSILAHKAPLTSPGRWLELSVATLDSRDKFTKLIQYSARLLAWWTNSARFQGLAKSLSSSRKAYRLGRSLIEVQKLQSILWSAQFLSTGKKRGSPSLSESSTSFEEVSHEGSRGSSAADEGSADSEEAASGSAKPKTYRLKSTATFLKVAGTALYFLFDNLDFITSAGFLDRFDLPDRHRLRLRKKQQNWFATKSNQADFIASIAGLYLTLRDYAEFWKKDSATSRSAATSEEGPRTIFRKLQEEKLIHILALVKSICHVILMANVTGVDLFQKIRGRKNNEGFHSLCGLVSAGAVLLKDYPNND